MKGKRPKKEQIVCVFQRAKAGIAVADRCRKHNCSEQSFRRRTARYGGIDVSNAKRLLGAVAGGRGDQNDGDGARPAHPRAEGRVQPKAVDLAERRC